MSNSSPKWKNPADVMKLRTVKRRTVTRRKTIHDPTDFGSILTCTTDDRPVGPANKRKNPFGCNAENKRPNLGSVSSLSEDKDQPRELFKALDVTNERLANELRSSDCPVKPTTTVTDGRGHMTDRHDKENSNHHLWNESKPTSYKSNQASSNIVKDLKYVDKSSVQESDSKSKSPAVVYHQHLPVDWSVKVKMRIVSEAPLAWCTQLKMVDEAKAVTQHVQGGQQWSDGEDKRSVFHSCCLHWVHPNIPWLRPFPRILPEQKISNVSIVGANEEATKALHRDWTESFTSVYHLLRSGKCPYFYLCTHQFTVVFRTSGVNQHSTINASLTPTTRGLREALKTEGISFRMPNLEGKKFEISPERGGTQTLTTEQDSELVDREERDGVTQDSPVPSDSTQPLSQCDEEDEEDLIDNDEGASVWLESLGLDKKNFPSLDPHKVKIQREGFRRVDNRPESLVHVEGADVQAMFNFLLNCRSCTASSGPQAGIPPSIIAPVAFKGATLKPNKLKHSVAKQTDSSGTIRKGHVIEMLGPILPHHVLNIAHLLREIQDEDFTLTFNTHEPTSSLNLRDTLCVSGLCKDVETSGLHPLAHLTLCGPDTLIDNRVYKEVRSMRQGFQYEL